MSLGGIITFALDFKNYRFFIVILFVHAALFLGILGDFQVYRSVVGFGYLLFVPGVVILRLLKLKNIDTTEKILFSVCLSIGFLMITFLFLDLCASAVGLLQPFSDNLIITACSIILVPLSLIKVDTSVNESVSKVADNRRRLLAAGVVFTLIIILGFYGLLLVNQSGHSIFLLLFIVSVSVIICAVYIWKKLFPSSLYPLVLFIACLTLLLFISNDTALVTNHITGRGDQWIEFSTFRFTSLNSGWVSFIPASGAQNFLQTYSTLSVTILPIVFERITGLGEALLFKMVYPIIVSFVAFGTYALYRTQADKKIAFLAAFFFITVSVGKGWGPDKQLVAQLFFIALLLVIFKKGLPNLQKYLLFLIFSTGLVVSHYSLSYIFMGLIVFTWIATTLMNRMRMGYFSLKPERIPFNFVLIYLLVSFSWFVFVNNSFIFDLLLQTLNLVISNLGQFFTLESRGTALIGLGLVDTPTIYNSLSSFLFLLTEFLLFFGLIWILTRKKRTTFNEEYKLIAALSFLVIAVNILLPRLADTFLMTRFYQTTLIILAPFSIIGGKIIVEHIPRIKQKHVISILAFGIFVPFFLFQTGLVYEIAGVQNYSFPLAMHRWDDLTLYDQIVSSQEVSGATWLSENTNISNISVLSDSRAKDSVLVGYSRIDGNQISVILNTTEYVPINQFIFLRLVNVVDGKIATVDGFLNTSQFSSVFENRNKVYSTGGCEIYYAGQSP